MTFARGSKGFGRTPCGTSVRLRDLEVSLYDAKELRRVIMLVLLQIIRHGLVRCGESVVFSQRISSPAPLQASLGNAELEGGTSAERQG